MSDIEIAKKRVADAKEELNNLEKKQQLEVNEKFIKEVDDNFNALEKLKEKMKNLETNENLTELANVKKELICIKSECFCHDYDDTPYGYFTIGPEKAHEKNTIVKRNADELLKKIKNRIDYLLENYNWIKWR